MQTADYIKAALRSAPQYDAPVDQFVHGALGIVGELAELEASTSKENAGEEIGDLYWYLAACTTAVGLSDFPAMGAYSPGLIGKLADTAKRWKFYKKAPAAEDASALIGGLHYYFSRMLCDQRMLHPGRCLSANIAKLKARYPEKFEVEKALTRDLAAEESALRDGGAGL